MRITQNMTADSSVYNLQQGRAKLDKLQELVASGVNINRPSDDPIGTSLMLSIGDQLKAGDQYASNITKATTFLQVSSTALQGMADYMQQAKGLVATLTNGSTDPTARASAVSQLTAIKQQIVDMGNTQLGNQYVFGGANGQKPFDAATAAYSGDENALKVEIGQSSTQQMNLPGNQILTGSSAILPANPANTPYGTTNILSALDNLITAVGANNVAGIQAGANALNAGADQITNAQTDVASRMMRLDSTSKMIANSKNTMETIVGNTQNVDYAKLAVELTNQQTAFQASLSATAKVSQMSLLNYMT
jgi:flagellar hook-associated protein 3 FlgL